MRPQRSENTPERAGASAVEVRIRRAAVACFAQRGYNGTGIRDIAKAAGMTSATLYHYTSSKEDLLLDIMVDSQTLLNVVTVEALHDVDRPERRLAVLVGTLAALHGTNPLSTRVSDTEIRSLAGGSAGREQVVALRDAYERMWAATLEQGVRDGIFDVSDPHTTRLALLTMCAGMSNWYRPGAGKDPHDLAAEFVDLALGAVRATRARRRVRQRDLPPLPRSFPPLVFEPEVSLVRGAASPAQAVDPTGPPAPRRRRRTVDGVEHGSG